MRASRLWTLHASSSDARPSPHLLARLRSRLPPSPSKPDRAPSSRSSWRVAASLPSESTAVNTVVCVRVERNDTRDGPTSVGGWRLYTCLYRERESLHRLRRIYPAGRYGDTTTMYIGPAATSFDAIEGEMEARDGSTTRMQSSGVVSYRSCPTGAHQPCPLHYTRARPPFQLEIKPPGFIRERIGPMVEQATIYDTRSIRGSDSESKGLPHLAPFLFILTASSAAMCRYALRPPV